MTETGMKQRHESTLSQIKSKTITPRVNPYASQRTDSCLLAPDAKNVAVPEYGLFLLQGQGKQGVQKGEGNF
ncbi:MAG: hypothetical protein L6455_07795 [Kiritimatiellae bacterium]|nr:hypothetical protein [Kiritimatiellia bacterium]